MKALKILQQSFPYYYNDDRKNTLLVLGLSVFIVLFLIVFHPLHLDHVRKIGMVGCVVFVVMFVNIVLFPKVFPDLFNSEHWTIGKYLLFTLVQCFQIGLVGSVIVKTAGFHPESTLWETIQRFYLNMLIYGSISIVLITILLRNAMLSHNLRNAIRANQELEKIRNLKNHDAAGFAPNTLTIYSDTTETIKLHLPDLLYIEANDNYSTFYWKNGHGLEKRMLRVNLKNIEIQLNNAYIIRCHRSFIVNINAITHVHGNTNGYKLSFRDTEFTVPVSRSKGKEVIEKIEQIRNLAEFG